MLYMTPYQTPRCAAPFISYMPFRLLFNVHAPCHSGYRLKRWEQNLAPAAVEEGYAGGKECHCRHDASVLLAGDLVDDLARISSLLLGRPANARPANRTFRRHVAVVLCVVDCAAGDLSPC